MNQDDKQEPNKQESPTEDLQVDKEQADNVTGGARSNAVDISSGSQINYIGLE